MRYRAVGLATCKVCEAVGVAVGDGAVYWLPLNPRISCPPKNRVLLSSSSSCSLVCRLAFNI